MKLLKYDLIDKCRALLQSFLGDKVIFYSAGFTLIRAVQALSEQVSTDANFVTAAKDKLQHLWIVKRSHQN